MDRLQIALDRYQQLAPALRDIDSESSDRLEQWLRSDVCPVVQNLLPNARFQKLSRWSPDHLASGVGTPERLLVEAVDRALVRCAGTLVTAGQRADVAKKLEQSSRQGPSQGNSHDQGGKQESTELATMEWIAQRPWFDLVCVEEYFHAERDLHLKKSSPERTAAFRQKHELRIPLGDYVQRSMFARIEFLKEHIDKYWQRCFLVVQGLKAAGNDLAKELFAAKVELDQSVRRLEDACRSGREPRLREACTALTQVYSAYQPNPDLTWLGCPADWGIGHAPLIRCCVRPPGEVIKVERVSSTRLREVGRVKARLCRPDVVQGIAAALDDVALLYRRPVETEELIGWERKSKRLVMVDRHPRTVYWDERKVRSRWDQNPKIWELLWTLAQKAKHGQSVDRMDVSRPQTQKAIVNRRSRLSTMIPGPLDRLIEPFTGGYRLVLDKDQIGLLRLDSDNQLVEAGAETKDLIALLREGKKGGVE